MTQPPKSDELDRLVRENLPSLLRFATRLAGDLDQAEEIVQESLWRAARNWSTFRGESEFRTWMYRIIVNRFRDSIKGRRHDNLPTIEQIDTRAAAPGDKLEQEELETIIASEISRLPPRQREALILVTFEQMSPQETANLLDTTVESVYSAVHLARKHLRRALADYLLEK